MSQELMEHAQGVTKTVVGGGVTYAATHAAFDLTEATQWASFFAAVMTGIYFFIVTVIAVVKARLKTRGK